MELRWSLRKTRATLIGLPAILILPRTILFQSRTILTTTRGYLRTLNESLAPIP
jgi:hypothetical protein